MGPYSVLGGGGNLGRIQLLRKGTLQNQDPGRLKPPDRGSQLITNVRQKVSYQVPARVTKSHCPAF